MFFTRFYEHECNVVREENLPDKSRTEKNEWLLLFSVFFRFVFLCFFNVKIAIMIYIRLLSLIKFRGI